MNGIYEHISRNSQTKLMRATSFYWGLTLCQEHYVLWHSYELGSLIILLVQMRELRLRENKGVVQSHRADKGQCWHVIPGLSDSWARNFHLDIKLQFKEKVKEELEVLQACGRDSSRLFLFIFKWLWFVIIFSSIFLPKYCDFVAFKFCLHLISFKPHKLFSNRVLAVKHSGTTDLPSWSSLFRLFNICPVHKEKRLI